MLTVVHKNYYPKSDTTGQISERITKLKHGLIKILIVQLSLRNFIYNGNLFSCFLAFSYFILKIFL